MASGRKLTNTSKDFAQTAFSTHVETATMTRRPLIAIIRRPGWHQDEDPKETQCSVKPTRA